MMDWTATLSVQSAPIAVPCRVIVLAGAFGRVQPSDAGSAVLSGGTGACVRGASGERRREGAGALPARSQQKRHCADGCADADGGGVIGHHIRAGEEAATAGAASRLHACSLAHLYTVLLYSSA